MAAATDQIVTTDPSTPPIIPVITTNTTLTTTTASSTTGTVPTKFSTETIDETKRKCSLGSITVESLSASSSSSSLGSANSTTLSASDHQSISSSLNDNNSTKNTGNNSTNNNTANNKPMVSITQMAAKGQPQKVLPFESIKTQLERNNIQPNAQYIQRHIDNIISHNEAIIDNWNLVNVRSSCNSSTSAVNETSSVNNSPCKPASPSPPSVDPSKSSQAKGSIGDLNMAHRASDGDRPLSSQGRRFHHHGGWPPASHHRLPASRSRKRWSTTALGGLQQLRQQNQQPTIDLSMNNNSGTSSISARSSSSMSPLQNVPHQRSLEEIQSDWMQNLRQTSMDQQALFQFKHSLEFDNSYNELLRRSSLQHLSRGATNPLNLEASTATPLIVASGHHQHPVICAPAQQEATRSMQHHATFFPFAPIPSSTQQQQLSTSDIQRLLELHRAQKSTEGQLESAIQNLSLRRREEDFLQQQQQLQKLSPEQQQQLQSMLQNQAMLNHRHETAGINPGGSALFVPLDFLNNTTRAHSHTHTPSEQNLLEDPAVLASLLQERHIQSLVGSVSATGAQESLWQNNQPQGDNIDLFSGVQTGVLDKLHQQQQVRNPSPTMGPSSMSHLNRRHHSMVHQLDPNLFSQLLATMCTDSNNSKQQQACCEGQPLPAVNHSERVEYVNGPLDSANPTHRCEVCDIPFWTRDLLNYHRLTQCKKKSAVATDKPLAFNFVGPNNYESLNQQMQTSEDQATNSSSVADRGKPSKSVSPSRSHGTVAAGTSLLKPTSAGSSSAKSHRLDGLSILKKQLLHPNVVAAAVVAAAAAASGGNSGMVIAPEALPLKKRKISEPNMRYRMT